MRGRALALRSERIALAGKWQRDRRRLRPRAAEPAEQRGEKVLGLRGGASASAHSASRRHPTPTACQISCHVGLRIRSLQYSDDVERFIAWRPEDSVVTTGRAGRADEPRFGRRVLGRPGFDMRRVLRQHHHLGADIDAAEQVGDVFIGQADAARWRRTCRSSRDRWCRECDRRWSRDTSRGRRADCRGRPP